MQLRAHVPVFTPTRFERARAARAMLRIHGLVAQALELTAEDIRQLQRGTLVEPCVCEEGWSVPGLRWGGVRLSDVVALAPPLRQMRGSCALVQVNGLCLFPSPIWRAAW